MTKVQFDKLNAKDKTFIKNIKTNIKIRCASLSTCYLHKKICVPENLTYCIRRRSAIFIRNVAGLVEQEPKGWKKSAGQELIPSGSHAHGKLERSERHFVVEKSLKEMCTRHCLVSNQ